MCVKSLQTRAEAAGNAVGGGARTLNGGHVSVRYKTYEAAARANHTHTHTHTHNLYNDVALLLASVSPPPCPCLPLLSPASSFNSMFVCPRGNINFCCCCIGNNYLLDTKTHRYNVWICVCVCVCSLLFAAFVSFLFFLLFFFAFFMLLLALYSKMQFYSCQGNLTPSAKMQALLAITPSSPQSPPALSASLASSCHVVPAPIVTASASASSSTSCLSFV